MENALSLTREWTGELTPRRASRVKWLTLSAAILGWSFDGIEMGVFPLIARPSLQELLGQGIAEETIRTWNGIFAAAFLFGAGLGGVVFGRLGDRVGRVKALSISVFVYASLTGVSSLAQSATQLATLRFLAAIGMGGEWALGVALVVETWPTTARPWLAGCIGAAVNLGYVAVAGLAWWLPPTDHWRLLLLICVAPAMLAFFVRRYVPESQAWKSSARSNWAELFSRSYRRPLASGIAAGTVLILAIWGGVQFTQLWAAQLGGPQAAATVQIISASSAIGGAFLGPLLLNNVSRRRAWALLCCLALVIAEGLFFTQREFGFTYLLGVGALGMITGAVTGWITLYLPELFPTSLRASGAGICYNSGRVFAAIGVLLTSGTIDLRGNYPLACALVSGVYLIGLAFAPCMTEPGEIQSASRNF